MLTFHNYPVCILNKVIAHTVFEKRSHKEVIQLKHTSSVSTGSRKISPGSFACSWLNVLDKTVVKGFNFKSTTLRCDFS